MHRSVNRIAVEDVTIRGLRVEAATTPITMQASFAAGAFDGALRIEYARKCALEKVEKAITD